MLEFLFLFLDLPLHTRLGQLNMKGKQNINVKLPHSLEKLYIRTLEYSVSLPLMVTV